MMNQIEIWASRWLIRRLKRGYGADCESKDTDDFPEVRANLNARCASCQAKEVIEFLEHNINLIKL